jgi:hypothetical protein
LTVNVRNPTPGYPLQRVAELPSKIIDGSNINGSQVRSRSVVFFDLESLLQGRLFRTGDDEVDVASPGARAIKLNVQGSLETSDRHHAGAQLFEPSVQPLPDRGNVGLGELPNRQFPLRGSDG